MVYVVLAFTRRAAELDTLMDLLEEDGDIRPMEHSRKKSADPLSNEIAYDDDDEDDLSIQEGSTSAFHEELNSNRLNFFPNLPAEIIIEIFRHLSLADLCSAAQVRFVTIPDLRF